MKKRMLLVFLCFAMAVSMMFAAAEDSNVSAQSLISTNEGAQIRIEGIQGLRFISGIDKTAVDFGRVVEYGTLLIPSADITDPSELVIGATLNGHNPAKVRAKYVYEETETFLTFTAVLINIPETQYKSEITARAYAILDDDTVIYGDTFADRSVYRVATIGYQNTGETKENRAAFAKIINRSEDNDLFDLWR